MKKFLNNIVAVAVVMIVFLIIVPLPAVVLDFMFIINIIISLMILLMTMYIKETLEFSIFPSMLLITTLFRLGLNISSTRLILTKGGDAGNVIEAFGSFVLSGNVVVGFIIFIIIVLVQFIVITKGSERVAEVSARFTLDAMPGKQMAIDADLNSGLIDEKQAKTRRENIQREAEFYGSMDGATKFVKGDAIMSIIITAINFIAGIIIGAVQGGMSFAEVLNIYSIATVGDGLVSQIPALLISTATGMIVTRSASKDNLSVEITKQFFAQPIVLIITGVAVGILGLLPKMPHFQFLLLAAVLLFFGIRTAKTQKNLIGQQSLALSASLGSGEGGEDEIPDEAEYYKNIDNVYNLLQIDAIEMEFGYSLLPIVDERAGSSFIERLVMFRRQFALEMGAVVPEVRLRDNGYLSPNQYVIKIKGEEVSKGEILVDYYLALNPGNLSGEIDGIETIEPAYGIPSKWITADQKELAEIYGYTVIDSLSVIITHLSETVKRYANELLSRQDVNQLLDNVKKYNATLVDDVVPNLISYSGLQKILANLLREGVPIRDVETILETISDYAPSMRDTEMLTEYVRQSLKRTITRKWSEGGQIRVITLDGEVEKTILAAINKNDQGTYLALDPNTIQKIVSNLITCIGKVKDAMPTPIILTSPVVRIYFAKMLEQFYHEAVVLSFNEIDTNVQILALANSTLEEEESVIE